MVRRQTTGRSLSDAEAFVGLVDYGLFSEKLPPCFTSEGLSRHVPATMQPLETETNSKKLWKLLSGAGLRRRVARRANRLKGLPQQEQDRHRLLIYQLWREGTLRSEGQPYLADLKSKRFRFVEF